jgi:hypothetical protein
MNVTCMMVLFVAVLLIQTGKNMLFMIFSKRFFQIIENCLLFYKLTIQLPAKLKLNKLTETKVLVKFMILIQYNN